MMLSSSYSGPATVERYIALLKQSFVVFRLTSLNRNVCDEIKKGKKVRFPKTFLDTYPESETKLSLLGRSSSCSVEAPASTCQLIP